MLRLKHIPIRTFGENRAYIRQENAVFKGHVQQKSCLELRHQDRSICAFLYPLTRPQHLAIDEIGIDENTYRQLDVADGHEIEIAVVEPDADRLIDKKNAGNILTASEYQRIIHEIDRGCISLTQLSSLMRALAQYFVPEELSFLVASLIGRNRLFWDEYALVTDCRSIGTMNSAYIEFAAWMIASAYGFPQPKVLTPYDEKIIDFLTPLTDLRWSVESFQKILRENNICVSLQESLSICRVGLKMMQIFTKQEMALPVYIALLLAVEASLGVSHLLIDIMIGKNSIVKNAAQALQLKNTAEYIAKEVGIHLRVILSDDQASAENMNLAQVAEFFSQSAELSPALKEQIYRVAGQVLEFDPNLSAGEGRKVAQKLLESGKVYETFAKVVRVQAQYRRMQ